MKKYQYLILFFIINFAALAIGSWLMDNGPRAEWYQNLNQAPWTPPGWFFGVAWSTIMICFSFYMTSLVRLNFSKQVWMLFIVQFILNVSWNYIFFNQHLVSVGLIIILILTFIIGVFLVKYKPLLQAKTWLIAPYFVWLIIASTLNAYIYFNN